MMKRNCGNHDDNNKKAEKTVMIPKIKCKTYKSKQPGTSHLSAWFKGVAGKEDG